MLYDEIHITSSHPSTFNRQAINGDARSMQPPRAVYLQHQRLPTVPNHQHGLCQETMHLHPFTGTMIHEEMQQFPIRGPIPHHSDISRMKKPLKQTKRSREPTTFTSYDVPQSSHFSLSQKQAHGPPPKKVKMVAGGNAVHSISSQKFVPRTGTGNPNRGSQVIQHIAHQTKPVHIQRTTHQTSPMLIGQKTAHQNAVPNIPPQPIVSFGSASSRWTGSAASLPPPPDLSLQRPKQSPPVKSSVSLQPQARNVGRGVVPMSHGKQLLGQPKLLSKQTVKSKGPTSTNINRQGSLKQMSISGRNLTKANHGKLVVPRSHAVNTSLHRVRAGFEHFSSVHMVEENRALNGFGQTQNLADGETMLSASDRFTKIVPAAIDKDKIVGFATERNLFAQPKPKSVKVNTATSKPKPKFVPSISNVHLQTTAWTQPGPKSSKGKSTTARPKTKSVPSISNTHLQTTAWAHPGPKSAKGKAKSSRPKSNMSKAFPLQTTAQRKSAASTKASVIANGVGKKAPTHEPNQETAHPIALTITEHSPICKTASTNAPQKAKHFCKCCVKPAKKAIPKLKTNRGRLEEQRALALQKELSVKNRAPLPLGLTRLVDEEADDQTSVFEDPLAIELCQSEFPKVILKKLSVSQPQLDNIVSLKYLPDENKEIQPIELTYRKILQDDHTVVVINTESEIDLVSEDNDVILEYVSTCASKSQPVQKNIPPLTCRICLLSFHNFDTYIRHKWNHRGIRRQVERFRSQPTKNVKPPTSKKSLGYKIVRHNSRPFMCETCGKNFLHRRDVTVHLRVHTGEKPYVCTICNKRFSQNSQLKRHLDSHLGGKPFQCEICDNRYSRKDGLKRHMLTHSGVRPYSCNLCGKSFTYSSVLAEHMATHRNDKPHKCSFCDQRFIKKNKLIEHERRHTGHKPFVCNTCNACFTASRLLNSHLKNHAIDKPFQCDECGRGFTQKSTLAKHMISHSDEKPWECEECGKAFAQQQYLKNHMRIHSDIKPYTCSHCGWGFRDKTSHVRHERLHTGVRPYKCDRCDKSFNRSTHLTKHKKCHEKYALISLSKKLQEEIERETKMLADLKKTGFASKHRYEESTEDSASGEESSKPQILDKSHADADDGTLSGSMEESPLDSQIGTQSNANGSTDLRGMKEEVPKGSTLNGPALSKSNADGGTDPRGIEEEVSEESPLNGQSPLNGLVGSKANADNGMNTGNIIDEVSET